MLYNEYPLVGNKAKTQASVDLEVSAILQRALRKLHWAILAMAMLTASCATKPTLPASQPFEQPSATAKEERNLRIILPVCNCEEYISANDSIIVRLRWGAKTKGLAEKGANSIAYNTTIDDVVLEGFDEWRKPAVFVPKSAYGEDAWWVYWDYALGKLPIGVHTIRTVVTPSATLFDGWITFQKGKSEKFEVILHIGSQFPDITKKVTLNKE